MTRVPRPAARTALTRLIAHTETWLIGYHPEGPYWSAERREGTAVRYLAGATTAELADLIDAAEAELHR